MLEVPSEGGHHLLVLDSKTIATLINQSFCAELIDFYLTPNLLITIHRLLNINSPNELVYSCNIGHLTTDKLMG